MPFDVDETVLAAASAAVADEYPTIAVHAVAGNFEHHLPLLPAGGRRLAAFLGGTIGNLLAAQRAGFLRTLAQNLAPGDGLLLGTDLVKDPARLVAPTTTQRVSPPSSTATCCVCSPRTGRRRRPRHVHPRRPVGRRERVGRDASAVPA